MHWLVLLDLRFFKCMSSSFAFWEDSRSGYHCRWAARIGSGFASILSVFDCPCSLHISAPVAGESGVALWKGRFDLPTQLRFLHNTDPDLIFSDIACRARI